MTAEMPTPVISFASTQPQAPTTNRRSEIRICSAYPVTKSATRRHSRNIQRPNGTWGVTCDTTYQIPAAPRDSYAILACFDAMALMTGWSPDGPKENTLTPGHIPVEVVSNDLVNTWSAHTIAAQDGHGPGIGIIAGELPTDAELAHLRERQRAFFEWLIQDGNDKFLRGETKNITNIHRQAAHWILGEAAQQLPWYPKMERRIVKDCPRCAKQILAAALGCEHCSLDLIDWYEKHTHLKPDEAVAQFVTSKRTAAIPMETVIAGKAIEPPLKDSRSAGQPKDSTK